VEGRDDHTQEEATIDGLAKKYPWWSPRTTEGQATEPEERASELTGVFKGKNTFL
jgi:hypothetical protein